MNAPPHARDPWLRRRAERLRERMDDPRCDPARLQRTYAQFPVVNQLVGAWRAAYARRLRPTLEAAHAEGWTPTLLDVGCGGGDLARRLAAWAACDGLPVRITATDPDPRALAYARRRAAPPNVRFVAGDADTLASRGHRYDLVVSNHVLHHLPDEAVAAFLATTGRLSARFVLHADLRRTPLALPAFALISWPFRRSFVREDGFRSIRRAFTPGELRRHAPPGWRVEPIGPFRQWVVLRAPP